MYICTKLLYPFICCWTSRLFPCPSYCKDSFEVTIWLWEYQIVYENKWTRRVFFFVFFFKSIAFALCMERLTPAVGNLLKCQVSFKRVKSFTQCIPKTANPILWSLYRLSMICALEVCPHLCGYIPISGHLKFLDMGI